MKEYIEYAAIGIEIIGVGIIVIAGIISLVRYFINYNRGASTSYEILRHDLGKGILLGLEFLVAADIIATVNTEPTMNKVLVLGVIVLIRTFLSISIQVEIYGKFPWQKD